MPDPISALRARKQHPGGTGRVFLHPSFPLLHLEAFRQYNLRQRTGPKSNHHHLAFQTCSRFRIRTPSHWATVLGGEAALSETGRSTDGCVLSFCDSETGLACVPTLWLGQCVGRG
jgi:hypothetical protein